MLRRTNNRPVGGAMRHTRREFMGLAAAGAAGMLLRPRIADARALIAAFSESPDPDLVVVNAKVYTMDTAAPRAEAFAIAGGRFVAVGSTSEIRALAGKKTQTY